MHGQAEDVHGKSRAKLPLTAEPLLPTTKSGGMWDFWKDDPNNGDVIQYLYFCIEGEPDAYRIAFMRSSLDDCAHPHNTHERQRVEAYIRHKVSALFARKSSPFN